MPHKEVVAPFTVGVLLLYVLNYKNTMLVLPPSQRKKEVAIATYHGVCK